MGGVCHSKGISPILLQCSSLGQWYPSIPTTPSSQLSCAAATLDLAKCCEIQVGSTQAMQDFVGSEIAESGKTVRKRHWGHPAMSLWVCCYAHFRSSQLREPSNMQRSVAACRLLPVGVGGNLYKIYTDQLWIEKDSLPKCKDFSS